MSDARSPLDRRPVDPTQPDPEPDPDPPMEPVTVPLTAAFGIVVADGETICGAHRVTVTLEA